MPEIQLVHTASQPSLSESMKPNLNIQLNSANVKKAISLNEQGSYIIDDKDIEDNAHVIFYDGNEKIAEVCNSAGVLTIDVFTDKSCNILNNINTADLHINSAAELRFYGEIKSNDMTINAKSVELSQKIYCPGVMTVETQENFTLKNKINVGNLNISASNIYLSDNVTAKDDISLTAKNEIIIAEELSSKEQIHLKAENVSLSKKIVAKQIDIIASEKITNDATLHVVNDVIMQAALIDNNGTIKSNGNCELHARDRLFCSEDSRLDIKGRFISATKECALYGYMNVKNGCEIDTQRLDAANEMHWSGYCNINAENWYCYKGANVDIVHSAITKPSKLIISKGFYSEAGVKINTQASSEVAKLVQQNQFKTMPVNLTARTIKTSANLDLQYTKIKGEDFIAHKNAKVAVDRSWLQLDTMLVDGKFTCKKSELTANLLNNTKTSSIVYQDVDINYTDKFIVNGDCTLNGVNIASKHTELGGALNIVKLDIKSNDVIFCPRLITGGQIHVDSKHLDLRSAQDEKCVYREIAANTQILETQGNVTLVDSTINVNGDNVSSNYGTLHLENSTITTEGQFVNSKNAKLSVSDRHWYQDDEVNHLLQSVIAQYPDVDLLTAMLGTDWQAGNTLKDQLVQYNIERTRRVDLGQSVNNKVIIPINLGTDDGQGIHWVLLYIDYASGVEQLPKLTYIDPFGNNIPATLLDNLHGENFIPNTEIDFSKVKLQHDVHNCGPWIVHCAAFLMKKMAEKECKNIAISSTLQQLLADNINIVRQNQQDLLQNSPGVRAKQIYNQDDIKLDSVYLSAENIIHVGNNFEASQSRIYVDNDILLDDQSNLILEKQSVVFADKANLLAKCSNIILKDTSLLTAKKAYSLPKSNLNINESGCTIGEKTIVQGKCDIQRGALTTKELNLLGELTATASRVKALVGDLTGKINATKTHFDVGSHIARPNSKTYLTDSSIEGKMVEHQGYLRVDLTNHDLSIIYPQGDDFIEQVTAWKNSHDVASILLIHSQTSNRWRAFQVINKDKELAQTDIKPGSPFSKELERINRQNVIDCDQKPFLALLKKHDLFTSNDEDTTHKNDNEASASDKSGSQSRHETLILDSFVTSYGSKIEGDDLNVRINNWLHHGTADLLGGLHARGTKFYAKGGSIVAKKTMDWGYDEFYNSGSLSAKAIKIKAGLYANVLGTIQADAIESSSFVNFNLASCVSAYHQQNNALLSFNYGLEMPSIPSDPMELFTAKRIAQTAACILFPGYSSVINFGCAIPGLLESGKNLWDSKDDFSLSKLAQAPVYDIADKACKVSNFIIASKNLYEQGSATINSINNYVGSLNTDIRPTYGENPQPDWGTFTLLEKIEVDFTQRKNQFLANLPNISDIKLADVQARYNHAKPVGLSAAKIISSTLGPTNSNQAICNVNYGIVASNNIHEMSYYSYNGFAKVATDSVTIDAQHQVNNGAIKAVCGSTNLTGQSIINNGSITGGDKVNMTFKDTTLSDTGQRDYHNLKLTTDNLAIIGPHTIANSEISVKGILSSYGSSENDKLVYSDNTKVETKIAEIGGETDLNNAQFLCDYLNQDAKLVLNGTSILKVQTEHVLRAKGHLETNDDSLAYIESQTQEAGSKVTLNDRSIEVINDKWRQEKGALCVIESTTAEAQAIKQQLNDYEKIQLEIDTSIVQLKQDGQSHLENKRELEDKIVTLENNINDIVSELKLLPDVAPVQLQTTPKKHNNSKTMYLPESHDKKIAVPSQVEIETKKNALQEQLTLLQNQVSSTKVELNQCNEKQEINNNAQKLKIVELKSKYDVIKEQLSQVNTRLIVSDYQQGGETEVKDGNQIVIKGHHQATNGATLTLDNNSYAKINSQVLEGGATVNASGHSLHHVDSQTMKDGAHVILTNHSVQKVERKWNPEQGAICIAQGTEEQAKNYTSLLNQSEKLHQDIELGEANLIKDRQQQLAENIKAQQALETLQQEIQKNNELLKLNQEQQSQTPGKKHKKEHEKQIQVLQTEAKTLSDANEELQAQLTRGLEQFKQNIAIQALENKQGEQQLRNLGNQYEMVNVHLNHTNSQFIAPELQVVATVHLKDGSNLSLTGSCEVQKSGELIAENNSSVTAMSFSSNGKIKFQESYAIIHGGLTFLSDGNNDVRNSSFSAATIDDQSVLNYSGRCSFYANDYQQTGRIKLDREKNSKNSFDVKATNGTLAGSADIDKGTFNIDNITNAADFAFGRGSYQNYQFSDSLHFITKESLQLNEANQRNCNLSLSGSDIRLDAAYNSPHDLSLTSTRGDILFSKDASARNMRINSAANIKNNGNIINGDEQLLAWAKCNIENYAGLLRGQDYCQMVAENDILNICNETNQQGEHDILKKYDAAAIVGGMGSSSFGTGVYLKAGGHVINDGSVIMAKGDNYIAVTWA